MNTAEVAARIRRDRDNILTIFAVLATPYEPNSSAHYALRALLDIRPEETDPAHVGGIFEQVGEASAQLNDDGEWDVFIDVLVDEYQAWCADFLEGR